MSVQATLASIVIPAHNEAGVIGRLLQALKPGNGLQVIVACNGCTDDTAGIAARHGATVIEVETPSKIAALNAGDAAVAAFPVIFIDADVHVSRTAIDALVDALRQPGVHCAAPPLRVDVTGCSLLVRAYFAIWSRLPYLRDGYVGSGVYGLSREGRSRFDHFPAIIADDLFVRDLFPRSERSVVATEPFVIQAPRTLASLLRRRIRIDQGNLELRTHPQFRSLPGRRESTPSWLRVPLAHPQLMLAAPVYAVVNLMAKIAARRRLARKGPVDWGRDETSRSAST